MRRQALKHQETAYDLRGLFQRRDAAGRTSTEFYALVMGGSHLFTHATSTGKSFKRVDVPISEGSRTRRLPGWISGVRKKPQVIYNIAAYDIEGYDVWGQARRMLDYLKNEGVEILGVFRHGDRGPIRLWKSGKEGWTFSRGICIKRGNQRHLISLGFLPTRMLVSIMSKEYGANQASVKR